MQDVQTNKTQSQETSLTVLLPQAWGKRDFWWGWPGPELYAQEALERSKHGPSVLPVGKLRSRAYTPAAAQGASGPVRP